MNVNEIANRYVSLCKEGQFHKCLEELFSNDAVSVEAWAPPGQDLSATGLAAIRAKGKSWSDNHEIRKGEVSGPFPNGNRFTVRFSFEVTNKPMNKRMTMEEIGLFTVENGKIVREEFFYQAG
jgi:hypothetical protein